MTAPTDPKEGSAAPCVDGGLTIAQAAAKLNTSRPYAMTLVNGGRLGETNTSPDGKLRVATEAVEAYLAERRCEPVSMAALQDAAMAAGMYEIPEDDYTGFVREK